MVTIVRGFIANVFYKQALQVRHWPYYPNTKPPHRGVRLLVIQISRPFEIKQDAFSCSKEGASKLEITPWSYWRQVCTRLGLVGY